jgi:hypothetical protein
MGSSRPIEDGCVSTRRTELRGRASTITLTDLVKTLLVTPAHALAILAFAAGCGSKPSPPGGLENVGGSSGREPDASASGGSSGSGSAPVLDGGLPVATGAPDGGALDAGPDAGATEPDAAPAAEDGCVVDPLESRCSEVACPDLDEAADWLLADDPIAVVRRPCEGADGTRFITIGAGYGLSSAGYIYDAESGELVSTYTVSDVPEFCSAGDASNVGFYGRVIQDCASVNPNDVTTPCDDGPGGPGNGGPGNGGPGPGPGGPGTGADPSEECIYIND